MKHTEGEWVVIQRPVEREYHVISGGYFVANCGSYNKNRLPNNSNAKANAHLMAAAPDMYEALKSILEERLMCHETEAAHIPPEIELAYKAVSKAEDKDKDVMGSLKKMMTS